MLIRPALSTPLPRDLPCAIDVMGSGRAVRALLTVAALGGAPHRFRIWCRHHARAELLRIHLADLPPLSAQIVVADQPPSDGHGPVVLALGLRTSRRSRQRSKDALFDANLAIIDGFKDALRRRHVIVVTNPSTRLTAHLAADGIAACGIGVMNDQLRFEREAGPGLRLFGAHNPFELGFGRLGQGGEQPPAPLSRVAYRDLTNRQDRLRPLLEPEGPVARLAPGLHERAWRDLGDWHDGLGAAERWYARQRLASRYLENGIACGQAILAAADLMTGRAMERADLTLELPMRTAGHRLSVVGWPIDTVTGEPRALDVDEGSRAVLEALSVRYGVASAASPLQADTCQVLRGFGVPSLSCDGPDMAELATDILPLAELGAGDQADAAIRLGDSPEALAARAIALDLPPLQVAQHRGKNAFEHRDLSIERLPGERRLVKFATSGAVALVDDAARQIVLAATPGPGRRDEFRKLVRDQFFTPAYAAAGAWVLHAGLVRFGDANLLLLGDSGAGKTTAALHLLARREGGYGASERVLLFRKDGHLMALGVPESLTIFRGSLRGLAGFADLVADADTDGDWQRAHKLRLGRDAVVARLGSFQIAEPVAVSHVALLSYRTKTGPAADTADVSDAAIRLAALDQNDLTTSDDVRASWLDWFEARRDASVRTALADPSLPFASVQWREPEALAGALAAFVTRTGATT
jgi:hypothetical protein